VPAEKVALSGVSTVPASDRALSVDELQLIDAVSAALIVLPSEIFSLLVYFTKVLLIAIVGIASVTTVRYAVALAVINVVALVTRTVSLYTTPLARELAGKTIALSLLLTADAMQSPPYIGLYSIHVHEKARLLRPPEG
jgi:hypothetical protein